VASQCEGVAYPIHAIGISAMGMYYADSLNFEELAIACEEEGRWEYFCVIAPLRIEKGTGSPVNPIAVFWGGGMPLQVVIIGSVNIGTDLMYKVLRNKSFDLLGVAAVDPASDGLARARALGIATSDRGIEHFLAERPGAELAFDASSARAHAESAPLLAAR